MTLALEPWGDTCAEVVGLADDLLDGLLPTDRAELMLRHLEDCPGCTTYVDQLRAVIALVGSLGAG